jgi:drug/metabolite transporter (DMT)-like permease
MAVSRWFALACSEGVTKAGSQVTQRGLISPHASSMSAAQVSVYLLNVLFFIELFRAICGGALLRFKKERLKISKIQHAYALAFASIAFVMSIATLWAFQYGNADTSIAQFLELWSILVGALLDYFLFKDRVKPWQWCFGIPCFLIAGWVFLGQPDLYILLTPPIWLALFIVNAVLLACNEALARQMTQLQGANLGHKRATCHLDRNMGHTAYASCPMHLYCYRHPADCNTISSI